MAAADSNTIGHHLHQHSHGRGTMEVGEFTGFNLSLRKPGIAWFEFNTPERLNGMTTGIKRDLIEAVTQAQMDNAVRVLVFTGSGRAFCAVDELKAYSSAERSGISRQAPSQLQMPG